ncbi:hypothetical protein [Bosea sp. 124]|uniref:hypothetical protein n=1 Tax=Bosea sp. 124 TaxID=2135642 RepID=UPI000D41F032|nr:hypothetical protein [Bosea sp. 124]PTM38923.1 hypothetical protein C8D03_0398 [Bosea sp. 124]
MIIIFVLLGLGFLCGGGAAIVDGLPYMVLERGFTQVIIGTVMAAAGVVMLALAWVLVELRRLKTTLSGTAMAVSLASMAGSPGSEREAAIPGTSSGPGSPAATLQPGLADAGVGALAGAALVGTQAFGEPREPADTAVEPDLFGAHLARQAAPETGDGSGLAESGSDVADILPAFDPFRPVDPQGEPEPATAAPESGLPMLLPELPDAEPAAIPEAEGAAGERAPSELVAGVDEGLAAAPVPSDIDDPFTAALTPPLRENDEFGLLRESLAGLRRESERPDGRIEPSFADAPIEETAGETAGERAGSRPDDLAAAGSWMNTPSRRHAPWFAEPEVKPQEDGAGRPDAAPAQANSEPSWPRLDTPEPEAPHWPPHAREAEAFEPAPATGNWEDTPDAQAAPEVTAFEPAPPLSPEAEPLQDAVSQPEAPEAELVAEAAAPAASDEGIVGAYQVGEAHFTIYADGSIQARTPDGDYSFASMDELKIYLASEKSRLGS